MLKNILNLEGVNKLTKKEQNNVFGGTCQCGIPQQFGGGHTAPIDQRAHPEVKTRQGCNNYCDSYRDGLTAQFVRVNKIGDAINFATSLING